MSNIPNRRRTFGSMSRASANVERDIEMASSLHSDNVHPPMADYSRRSIGTRSAYGAVPPAAVARDSDDPHTDYSQTSGSVRDRTMLLSNLGLIAGRRESTQSHRGDHSSAHAADTAAAAAGGGGSRRSSLDDRSSIDMILAEAHSGVGNLSRLLRERSPQALLPVSRRGATSNEYGGDVDHLPPLDPAYLGTVRVPKNAKRTSKYSTDAPQKQQQQQEPALPHLQTLGEHCGSVDRPINLHSQRLHAHADADKQQSGEQQSEHAHGREGEGEGEGERAQLLPASPSVCYSGRTQAAAAESGYAHLQRRSSALIDLVLWPLQYIPAVILGLILNLLDGLSYGLIAFPVSMPVFDKFGPVGFSMYMLSTAVAQFVYSSGASAFRGANGSMLIEAIPFLHAMCATIAAEVGKGSPDRIIATTLVAYAASTVLTGLVFFMLGFLRIGSLVDFFPRHILVGCIGGVGYFLFQTGMEVTSRVKLELSWATLAELFVPNTLGLWSSSLLVALLLRALNTRYTHPLFVPVFFMIVPAAFYLVAAALGLSLSSLRATGWVFELPSSDVPFYHFYTLFDFGNTDWYAVWRAVPTMLGLAFFSILHVPINVPALAVSTNADKVDTNRELVAHGISNLLSGVLGSFQNYLVYSNSLLFIRSGGESNLAGMMLGIATLAVFFAGPALIGFIPTMVVGALIFHLGLELLREALLDTVGVVNRIEYATIVSIVLAMAILGFNEGIFLGILLACFFFILLYSRRSAVRKAYTGSAVRSTVRRLYGQRRFLDGVCKQIQVMRLQGFMFFGTINGVEASIRGLLEKRQWQANPIRFLVLDFALVNGMDFSAAEAFIRVRRLLEAREIYMVVCGVKRTSEVGRALRSAGVWSDCGCEYVQTFPSLNEALEWCENVLLQYYYLHQAALGGTQVPQTYTIVSTPQPEDVNLYGTSPRNAMVSEATQSAMPANRAFQSPVPAIVAPVPPALPLLEQAFQDLDPELPVEDILAFIAPHFGRKMLISGQHLWRIGQMPLGLYLVESGTLRVFVESETGDDGLEAIESILPGTTLGELALCTGKKYSTTVVADGDVAMWELSKRVFDDLCASDPAQMLAFVRLALAYSAQGMKAITAYAFCAQ
ncbi:hypothetical protein GGI07_001085 [Coemansia sp. Benny D115]|nr:hypothetical protein GGI07_001085 [Coemansia sp. Benny D115]